MKYLEIIVIIFISHKVTADLTRAQKRRCEQFMSLYEKGKFELQYNYVENIHDRKGYTSGRSAFTTRGGDAFEVVRRYTVMVPKNPLARYVSELKTLSDRESGDVSNLAGYPEAWRQAATDPLFRQIQLDVSDAIYYRPAMILADKENVRTGLGQCIFYDTVVQNGNGDDLDSIGAIIRKTEQNMDGLVDANETKWLLAFIQIRRHILLHPHNTANKDRWGQHIDRVGVLKELILMANWELTGPINIDTINHSAVIL